MIKAMIAYYEDIFRVLTKNTNQGNPIKTYPCNSNGHTFSIKSSTSTCKISRVSYKCVSSTIDIDFG